MGPFYPSHSAYGSVKNSNQEFRVKKNTREEHRPREFVKDISGRRILKGG
jgi:hypothetical protein